jgi:hypothetical protein
MGVREPLIATPSFCWKNLSSTQKYVVLKHPAVQWQLWPARPFCQCVIIMELISDDLKVFVDMYISEKTNNIKANKGI